MARRAFYSYEDFEDWTEQAAPERLVRRQAFQGGNLAALWDAGADALLKGNLAELRKPEDPLSVQRWVLEKGGDL